MFNNVALDVFIGLTFVFLLYSLLATIIQEAIAGFLNLRGALLVKAIRVMLNDRQSTNYSSNLLLNVLQRVGQALKNQWNYLGCRLPDKSLAKAFYKHPSIKYLSTSSLRSKPSYINPNNFSSTLTKILRGRYYDGSIPEIVSIFQTLYPKTPNQLPIVNVGLNDSVIADIKPETLDQLRQLFVDADNDIDKFKSLLENWFNETMDRTNGWYKRQTKRILFFIGLFIAITGNVDTIKIYHILATNQSARDQMVQLATQSQNKYGSLVNDTNQAKQFDSAAYATVTKDIDNAGSILGIGWSSVKQHDSLLSVKHHIDSLADSLNNHIKSKSIALYSLTKKDSLIARQDSLAIKDSLVKKDFLIINQKAINSALARIEYKRWDSWSILGWLITALALTLGAPFWFDLLNKFISLRSSGSKPTDSDSNSSASDTTQAQPQPLSVTVNSSNTTDEEAVG